MYHTGSMQAFSTTFTENKAGIEGPAIISIGLLEKLLDVSFLDNAYYCSGGEFGYIVANEARLNIEVRTAHFLERPHWCGTCAACVDVEPGLRHFSLKRFQPPAGCAPTAPPQGMQK